MRYFIFALFMACCMTSYAQQESMVGNTKLGAVYEEALMSLKAMLYENFGPLAGIEMQLAFCLRSQKCTNHAQKTVTLRGWQKAQLDAKRLADGSRQISVSDRINYTIHFKEIVYERPGSLIRSLNHLFPLIFAEVWQDRIRHHNP